MTKHVAILTLPLSDNYGGMLQAIALYGYIKRLGFAPIFIQRSIKKSKGFKGGLIFLLERIPFQNLKNFRGRYVGKKKHSPELKRYIPEVSDCLNDDLELQNFIALKKIDAIIVGSDQVWRIDYIDDGAYGNYFLDFIKGTTPKKISYAASFGVAKWSRPDLNENIEKLLAEFCAVSVREASGKSICAENFNRHDAVHVIDPTLLVSPSFYDALVSTEKPKSKNALFTYILDSSASKELLVDAVINCLPTRLRRHSSGLSGGYLNSPRISEWVRFFSDADFVVTDSYHGMIFSIIFNKEFIVVANPSRGVERFESLLTTLGLTERLMYEEYRTDGAVRRVLEKRINYSEVNKKLEALRSLSRNFLVSALGDMHQV